MFSSATYSVKYVGDCETFCDDGGILLNRFPPKQGSETCRTRVVTGCRKISNEQIYTRMCGYIHLYYKM